MSPTEMQGEVYRLTRIYQGANRVRFGLGLGLESHVCRWNKFTFVCGMYVRCLELL